VPAPVEDLGLEQIVALVATNFLGVEHARVIERVVGVVPAQAASNGDAEEDWPPVHR
jgi:hypothetical protein